MKHNGEEENYRKEAERAKNGKNSSTVNGIAINQYARLEQANQSNKQM